jgi:hypothetical protein
MRKCELMCHTVSTNVGDVENGNLKVFDLDNGACGMVIGHRRSMGYASDGHRDLRYSQEISNMHQRKDQRIKGFSKGIEDVKGFAKMSEVLCMSAEKFFNVGRVQRRSC